MKRGEVRWYQFSRPDKKRPVVILTRDSALEFLGEVTVAPITTTIRDIPTEVLITRADGMLRDCAVNLDHIQTVSKGKIGSLIATLSVSKMQQMRPSLLFALGF
jgi:mRNA interferase MazF